MTDELPLSVRVNRLFDIFHRRSEPEQSNTDVASAVAAIVDRAVSAADLESLRDGARDADGAVDAELLTALARHFQVPPAYLTDADGDVAVGEIDRQLRLLSAARDAGVGHLGLRGSEPDIEALTALFAGLSAVSRPNEPN